MGNAYLRLGVVTARNRCATDNQAHTKDAEKQVAAASADFLAAFETDLVDPLSESSLETAKIKFLLEEVGLWSLEDNGGR